MSDFFKKFTLGEYLKEDAFPQVEHVISDLLCRQELCLLSATAKTGKTWLALHMALAVSNGKPFLGKYETKCSKVVFVQTEVSHPQFRERILDMLEEFPKPWNEENLIISHERFRLDTPEGIEMLGGFVGEVQPALLILDPLYTLHRKDEDKAKDMAPILTDLKQICLSRNVACLLTHHQGKSGEANGNQTGHQARGSSALADVPDNLWSLKRAKDSDTLNLSFEFRNIPASDPLNLRLTSSLKWEVLGAVDKKLKADSVEALAVLLQRGELARNVLIEQFRHASGRQTRTAENRIAKALELGLLKKRQEGGATFYSLTDSPVPQNRNPLESCVDAGNSYTMTPEEIQQQLQWEASNGHSFLSQLPNTTGCSLTLPSSFFDNPTSPPIDGDAPNKGDRQ